MSVARGVSLHGASARSMAASHSTGTRAPRLASRARPPGRSISTGAATTEATPIIAVAQTSRLAAIGARRFQTSGQTATAVSAAMPSVSQPCHRANATSAGDSPGWRNCSNTNGTEVRKA